MTHDLLHVSAEVRDAVAAGAPVLALESTIFTHGLPRPHNEELALATEQQVREAGVVPATIGVVKGRPTVGLHERRDRAALARRHGGEGEPA